MKVRRKVQNAGIDGADGGALEQDVAERAKVLMSLPPMQELDLPCAGKFARRLLGRLGVAT
jgi:hypothetical protein